MAGRHRFQPQIILELGLHLTVAPITLLFSFSAVVAVVTGIIGLFTKFYRPFFYRCHAAHCYRHGVCGLDFWRQRLAGRLSLVEASALYFVENSSLSKTGKRLNAELGADRKGISTTPDYQVRRSTPPFKKIRNILGPSTRYLRHNRAGSDNSRYSHSRLDCCTQSGARFFSPVRNSIDAPMQRLTPPKRPP